MSAVPLSPVPFPDLADLAHLVVRCGEGDQAAFEQLYRRTNARVYGVAQSVLRASDHAAEVTQEVYLEVWRQAGRYDPARGSVLAWLTTMTHRRAVDRVRSVATSAARDQRHGVATLERDVDSVADHVADAVCRRLDAARMRRALTRLTATQRETVVLVYLEGHTVTQVADQLGVPAGTVKSRLHSAVQALRRALPQLDPVAA